MLRPSWPAPPALFLRPELRLRAPEASLPAPEARSPAPEATAVDPCSAEARPSASCAGARGELRGQADDLLVGGVVGRLRVLLQVGVHELLHGLGAAAELPGGGGGLTDAGRGLLRAAGEVLGAGGQLVGGGHELGAAVREAQQAGAERVGGAADLAEAGAQAGGAGRGAGQALAELAGAACRLARAGAELAGSAGEPAQAALQRLRAAGELLRALLELAGAGLRRVDALGETLHGRAGLRRGRAAAVLGDEVGGSLWSRARSGTCVDDVNTSPHRKYTAPQATSATSHAPIVAHGWRAQARAARSVNPARAIRTPGRSSRPGQKENPSCKCKSHLQYAHDPRVCNLSPLRARRPRRRPPELRGRPAWCLAGVARGGERGVVTPSCRSGRISARRRLSDRLDHDGGAANGGGRDEGTRGVRQLLRQRRAGGGRHRRASCARPATRSSWSSCTGTRPARTCRPPRSSSSSAARRA